MPVMITLDTGRAVDVADNANAQLVADAFDRMVKRIHDSDEQIQKMEEELEKMESAKDTAEEELEKEKEKTTDAAISARVAAIAKTRDTARKIAGDRFSCDSMDVLTVQRAALAIARPKIDWGDKSATYVQAAWDAEEEKEDEEEEKMEEKTTDSYRQLARDAAVRNQAPDSRYAKTKDAMSQAWKKTAGMEVK